MRLLHLKGGTIASRFSRFEPRKKAVKMINELFDTNIEVKYYDGLLDSTDNNGGDLDDFSTMDGINTELE